MDQAQYKMEQNNDTIRSLYSKDGGFIKDFPTDGIQIALYDTNFEQKKDIHYLIYNVLGKKYISLHDLDDHISIVIGRGSSRKSMNLISSNLRIGELFTAEEFMDWIENKYDKKSLDYLELLAS